LGDIYLQGKNGVAKDLDEAQEWLELSAGHGFKKAEDALEALTKNAENDTMPAVNIIPTASAPVAKAKTTKIGSASQPTTKSTQSAHKMGMQYLRGDGVNKSYKKAAKYFSQAAEEGNAESQYQLGELLLKGKGVKRSKKLANKWYRAAAKQGHIKAKNRLDGCGFC